MPTLLESASDGAETRGILLLPPACGLPVTSGRRYAFLLFLYEDEAAKIHEANNQFLGSGVGAYQRGDDGSRRSAHPAGAATFYFGVAVAIGFSWEDPYGLSSEDHKTGEVSTSLCCSGRLMDRRPCPDFRARQRQGPMVRRSLHTFMRRPP